MKIPRRAALAGPVAIAGLSGANGARGEQVPPITVRLEINGVVHLVSSAGARDIGSFSSVIGGFIQDCLVAEIPELAMTVFFRSDRTSNRHEVVFELGRLFDGPPRNLGAYTVEIRLGEQISFSGEVSEHYWHSRWRWQSHERPVIADVDALISQWLVPPFARNSADRAGGAGLPGGGKFKVNLDSRVTDKGAALGLVGRDTVGSASTREDPSYSIMTLAGITPYMPQTGERDDIGLVTEPQGDFLVTRSERALKILRAQAEAAGTLQWHLRDERTSAPLNREQHPKASLYATASDASPIIHTVQTEIYIDAAHQPAVSYVPYLLTGDPYHLEDLQFQATWNWASHPPSYWPTKAQSRTMAWCLRTLGQAAWITPEDAPSWLLPRDYWVRMLEECRIEYETFFVEDLRPLRAVFRSTASIESSREEGPKIPYGTWIDPWQEEFLVSVVGWLVARGFKEWLPFLKWKSMSTVERTKLDGDWHRSHATPYRLLLKERNDAPMVSTWEHAWALNVRMQQWSDTDPNAWADGGTTYLLYTRGALVVLTALGLVDGREAIAWADGQLGNPSDLPKKWRIEPTPPQGGQ